MTRKRFKKLCMSCRVERDMAELMANLALALVGDYREALRGGLLEALEEAERRRTPLPGVTYDGEARE